MFTPPHSSSLDSFYYPAPHPPPTYSLSPDYYSATRTAVPAYHWLRPTEPPLISFRDTSVHAFPIHRTAALLLFESLHPPLYRHCHSLHSLLFDYTARLSNSRHHVLTASYQSTADYELHLRQQAFDTLWDHPLHSAHFRHIWTALSHYTAAVEWREWERTVSRLYGRFKRRMERVEEEEAAEQRRLAAERARTAEVEDGAALSSSYNDTRLSLLCPEVEDESEEEQPGWFQQ